MKAIGSFLKRRWVIWSVAGLVLLIGIGAAILLTLQGNAYRSYESMAREFAPSPGSVPMGGVGGGGAAIADDTLMLYSEEEVANKALPDTSQEQPQQRVILRDASLQIVVEDTNATVNQISTMAEEMGGWVVNANTTTYTNSAGTPYTNGSITVRVPAERLDEAMEIIRSGAGSVDNENINGRDVTEEYVDLSSRLRNLEATEEQLVAILETAFSVEDVLAVQTELTRVRENIEVIQGRLRFFDQAAAFSSISVTVREIVPSVGSIDIRWNPGETAANAFGTLIVIGQFIVDAAIVFGIVIIPVLIVLSLVVMVIRRVWRALRRKPVAPIS